jgi:hypothetical protein
MISMPASPMGALRSVLAWTTARLGNNVLHSLCPPKVKHVVPNDCLKRTFSLRFWYTLWTQLMLARRSRMQSASAAKAVADDELAAMMAKLMQ